MNAAVETVNRGIRRVPAWPLYLLGLVPAVWLFWLGTTGRLGVEPIEVLEHELGEIALQLMVAGLAVTPLRRLAGVNLLKFRRAIGLTCFFFVLAHLLVWAVLDVQALSRVWEDIVKRPYITVGMVSFALLLPLAVTSNNLSMRRLGAAGWRKLHLLTYPAAILGGAHYVMLVKGWQVEPLIYMGVILALLGLRLPIFAKPRRQAARQPATLQSR